MLCFANLAMQASQDYQVLFPPSTQFGVFHAKREFTEWPISHSVYNNADFTKGVDVSWYKNHTLANSIFAWNYQDDFFAGYDHGKEAGTMTRRRSQHSARQEVLDLGQRRQRQALGQDADR